MKKILCVCIGNSDRSPVMAAVLAAMLRNAGHDVTVESAGVGDSAKAGGPAAPFAIAATKRIGLDLSGHVKRNIASIDVNEFDLIVCASDDIAGQVMGNNRALMKKIFNAQVTNPWPVQFEQDYETTMVAILGAMYKVVARYFP